MAGGGERGVRSWHGWLIKALEESGDGEVTRVGILVCGEKTTTLPPPPVKVTVNTNITTLADYLAHVMKCTNMKCLTLEKVGGRSWWRRRGRNDRPCEGLGGGVEKKLQGWESRFGAETSSPPPQTPCVLVSGWWAQCLILHMRENKGQVYYKACTI